MVISVPERSTFKSWLIAFENPLINIVKVPNTIPHAHALYEPNWSLYQYGKVAEMLRNGLYAENSSNLDQYSLYHRASIAGKWKDGHDVHGYFRH